MGKVTPADLIAGCARIPHEPDHQLAAVGSLHDLADRVGNRRSLRPCGSCSLEAGRQEARHVVLTVGLGPMGELDQEFDYDLLLMLLLLESFLAAIDRRRIGCYQGIGGSFQRGLLDRRRRRTGEVGIVVHRTFDIDCRGNDSVRCHRTEVRDRFDRMLLC